MESDKITVNQKHKESIGLRFLYRTVPGRVCLKMVSSRKFSCVCGKLMDSRISRCMIPGFIRKNGIDLSEYQKEYYHSFNDCFTRRIKPECRPIDRNPNHLTAPCDGYLSAFRITEDLLLNIKHSFYSVAGILKDTVLAGYYEGGICLVFRLAVDNYHRYCYADSGSKSENTLIPGRLHTVRPIAFEKFPVFTENTREYTVIDSDHFGKMVQMEVGAMMVGRISNHHGAKKVHRGEEKGTFLYGGSTVILFLEKDAVNIDEVYLEAGRNGVEIPVKLGERVGRNL